MRHPQLLAALTSPQNGLYWWGGGPEIMVMVFVRVSACVFVRDVLRVVLAFGRCDVGKEKRFGRCTCRAHLPGDRYQVLRMLNNSQRCCVRVQTQ